MRWHLLKLFIAHVTVSACARIARKCQLTNWNILIMRHEQRRHSETLYFHSVDARQEKAKESRCSRKKNNLWKNKVHLKIVSRSDVRIHWKKNKQFSYFVSGVRPNESFTLRFASYVCASFSAANALRRIQNTANRTSNTTAIFLRREMIEKIQSVPISGQSLYIFKFA